MRRFFRPGLELESHAFEINHLDWTNRCEVMIFSIKHDMARSCYVLSYPDQRDQHDRGDHNNYEEVGKYLSKLEVI